MSKHFNWIALPMAFAIAGVGGFAGAASEADAAAKPVSCEIRVSDAGGSVDLEAVMTATKAVSGSYEFEINSSSAAGTSSTSQGDDFTAEPGETSLGTVSLNGKYTAKLTVTYAGGSTSCVKRG